MTVHRETPLSSSAEDRSLARLRIHETALRQQAQQLQARAEHLNRVGLGHLERYARRVDAHEKIVLGALVKKAGLDVCRVDAVTTTDQPPNDVVLSSMVLMGEDKNRVPGSTKSNQQPNDVVFSSIGCYVGDLSTSYDRELILGGLLWLASVLDRAPGDLVAVPPHDGLRGAGRLAGTHVVEKKTGRPGV